MVRRFGLNKLVAERKVHVLRPEDDAEEVCSGIVREI
jgi:hypothetical protein